MSEGFRVRVMGERRGQGRRENFATYELGMREEVDGWMCLSTDS